MKLVPVVVEKTTVPVAPFIELTPLVKEFQSVADKSPDEAVPAFGKNKFNVFVVEDTRQTVPAVPVENEVKPVLVSTVAARKAESFKESCVAAVDDESMGARIVFR